MKNKTYTKVFKDGKENFIFSENDYIFESENNTKTIDKKIEHDKEEIKTIKKNIKEQLNKENNFFSANYLYKVIDISFYIIIFIALYTLIFL